MAMRTARMMMVGLVEDFKIRPRLIYGRLRTTPALLASAYLHHFL